jgi:enterochelin esterase family protein
MTHPLLARARVSDAPVVDRTSATFLWQGDRPPYLVGDFNGWNPEHAAPWSPVEDGLWAFTLELPADAYIEYAFLTEPKDDARLPDPLNDRSAPNGMGQVNNYFHMPAAQETPLIERVSAIRQGKLSRHRIENDWFLATGKRWVHLYQPPVNHPVPLLVVYDAQDYLTRGRITQIVDNLIAQGRIEPLAMALVDNGGPARGVEYSCNEATVGFMMMEVLPLARQRLNLIDPEQPGANVGGAYGALGASMGGLMALYTALRAPSVFGSALSQSGAFELGEVETVASHLVRHMPRQPLKIWMDVGRFEWLLEPNRRMRDLLVERAYDVTYREYNGGHNYPAWRNDLSRGLEALFGRS